MSVVRPEDSSFNPYTILGVNSDAQNEALKVAYRRLVRENHPDIAHDKTVATARMIQINAAWDMVGDPQKRAAFDSHRRLDEIERARRQARRTVASHAAQTARPTVAKPATSRTTSSSSTSSTRTTPRPTVVTARPATNIHTPGSSSAKTSTSKTGSSKSSSTTKKSSSRKKAIKPTKDRRATLAHAYRSLYQENNPRESLALCRSILFHNRRDIAARELMGESLLRLGNAKGAIAVWDRALRISPDNAALRRRREEIFALPAAMFMGANGKARRSLWRRLCDKLSRKK